MLARITLPVLAVFVLAFAAPAMAEQSPEWKACNGSEPEFTLAAQIAGCTKVIESGKEIPHDLAIAYYNRGYTYDDKGDFDLAIADYTRAIEIRPDYASPYNERCRTRAVGNRDLKQAMADCDKALALNFASPHLTLTNSGIIFFRWGQWAKAIAAFDAALKIKADHAPALFIRGCAKRRAGSLSSGDADIAAAKAASATIADWWAKWDIKP